MDPTLVFLFGKEVAYKMGLLEQALQAIQHQHRAYFATIASRFASANGQARPASLTEFVQVQWQAGQPMLLLDPALPAFIAADCQACVQQIGCALLPARPKRRWWWWR